jgi:hypothetical protein
MLVGLKIINMIIKELFLGLRYRLAPMGNYGVSAFSRSTSVFNGLKKLLFKSNS